MRIQDPTNVRRAPPPTPPGENQHVAERPVLEVETGDGAGPSSRVQPTGKSHRQKQLVEDFRQQQQRTAPPVEGSAQRVTIAEIRGRKAALKQLNEAICSGEDAKIIAACKLIKPIEKPENGIDETGGEWLKKLGAWLSTSQNTSEIKSLKTLAQSQSFDDVNKAIQQFANVQPQTQMSMQDRIFGAVERLRERMRPDPASPMTKINADGLQWLDQVLLSRDFKWALDAYKVVVRTDNRPEKEVERDVKDFRKLALQWLASAQNESSIKSLKAMVENTDIASIKQVIDNFATRTGNAPQEPTRRLVSSSVLALRHLTWQAVLESPPMSSGTQSSPLIRTQGQGTKRRASEEAGGHSGQRARTETNPDLKEGIAALNAFHDQELREEVQAIFASSDASPPPLFQD